MRCLPSPLSPSWNSWMEDETAARVSSVKNTPRSQGMLRSVLALKRKYCIQAAEPTYSTAGEFWGTFRIDLWTISAEELRPVASACHASDTSIANGGGAAEAERHRGVDLEQVSPPG